MVFPGDRIVPDIVCPWRANGYDEGHTGVAARRVS
jgi:hypothetical protein